MKINPKQTKLMTSEVIIVVTCGRKGFDRTEAEEKLLKSI